MTKEAERLAGGENTEKRKRVGISDEERYNLGENLMVKTSVVPDANGIFPQIVIIWVVFAFFAL